METFQKKTKMSRKQQATFTSGFVARIRRISEAVADSTDVEAVPVAMRPPRGAAGAGICSNAPGTVLEGIESAAREPKSALVPRWIVATPGIGPSVANRSRRCCGWKLAGTSNRSRGSAVSQNQLGRKHAMQSALVHGKMPTFIVSQIPA